MSCPKCGSNDLWDDNFWWGCNKCNFVNNGSIRNKASSNDILNKGQPTEYRFKDKPKINKEYRIDYANCNDEYYYRSNIVSSDDEEGDT